MLFILITIYYKYKEIKECYLNGKTAKEEDKTKSVMSNALLLQMLKRILDIKNIRLMYLKFQLKLCFRLINMRKKYSLRTQTK